MLLRRARRPALALIVAVTMLMALATVLAGCSGDTEEPAAPTQPASAPSPATGKSAAAADPTQAPAPTVAKPTSTPPPPPPSNLAAELPTDPDFPELSQIVISHLSGMNNIKRPRLNLPPDIREDQRRGGIVINIEFNGDEYDTTTKKKAELDKIMRGTYEVLFTSGHEVAEVTMTAIMIGAIRRVVGGTADGPIAVYKTRLKKDDAEAVEWSNKESIDFNEVWDTLILNPAWKRDLREGK